MEPVKIDEVIESVLIRLSSAEATLRAAKIIANSGQKFIAEQMITEAKNILKGLVYEPHA